MRTQHAEATQALQAERGRLDALNEEHRQERERLEQRAAAQERRLLEDVDRARQELKRVTLLLADGNKQGAKALAASQEHAQSLRVQVSVLRTESAGLARELHSAREDLRTANSQQEQFRKKTTDLLANLKMRLPKDYANAGKHPDGGAPATLPRTHAKAPKAKPASKRQ